jgi:hypothetical protein
MEVAPLLKAAGEGKVVPPPRVATLEGGPAYPATKVATQVICTKEGKVVPPPRVELGH